MTDESRLYYIISGGRQLLVDEKDIIYHSEKSCIIHTNIAYGIEVSIEGSTSAVSIPRHLSQPSVAVTLVRMHDVKLQYSLIAILQEEDPLYKAFSQHTSGLSIV